MKKAFYWGDTPPEKIEYHTREIFERQDYELLYPVKEGDVVVDIGACLGEFTWKNMDKASQVYAIEPDTEKHEELDHNIGDVSNVEVIKKAFHHSTGTYRFPFSGGGGETYVPSYEGEEERLREWGVVVDTINFKDFIKEYNLDKIDFLRTSCQGGEYSLFRDENLHFLKNNVRNIVGKFYLQNHEQETEFRYFRDKFLKPHFPTHKVFSVPDVMDITWSLSKDQPYDSVNQKGLSPFIEYYQVVYVYIENETFAKLKNKLDNLKPLPTIGA